MVIGLYISLLQYGTLDDLRNLTAEAGKRKIKIIMDFVPNHVSSDHEWFKKSIKKEGNYTDYFIWNSGKVDPKNSSNMLPPNNWLRIGAQNGESAWEFNNDRKEFFFFQFGSNMPDLNLRSEHVKEELEVSVKLFIQKNIIFKF